MPSVTFQDGFEGAEDLAAVYGIGNYGTVSVGGGRSGGNAITSVQNVPTGIASASDPVIVGVARFGSLGGSANIALSDTVGYVGLLSIDTFNRVAVNLPIAAGSPTVRSPLDGLRIGGVWRYLEWYHTTGTSGRVIVAVDGNVVIDFAGTTGSGDPARGPFLAALGGSAVFDDFYVGLPGSPSDFFGDYVVTGTAPSATGHVPTPSDVVVTQQTMNVASVALKADVTVDQQYIIVVIKNKGPATVRPQVFGVGRR